MSIETKAARIERKLLKRTPLTAGEIAERAGFPSGRGIAKSLRYLVIRGRAVMTGGRRPTYRLPA